MADQPPSIPPDQQISEEELRAAYEEQMRRVHVNDVLIQTVVSLLNLGGMRIGLGGAAEDRDLGQVRQAIEGVRALMPLVEADLGPDAGQLREVLSQLQLAYAREAGPAAPGDATAPPGGAPGQPGEAAEQAPDAPKGPGPAESSGRLWVPGS